jgi:molybdopterin-guanine dinucleotide biosynthesis protein A
MRNQPRAEPDGALARVHLKAESIDDGGTMKITRAVSVQAGGASSRMGQDKALMTLAGDPVIKHVLRAIEGLADQIIVTTNNPEDYRFLELPLFRDEAPMAGALEGLRTALVNSPAERTLLVACDMPFLQANLLNYLFEQSSGFDVTVPQWNDRLQPLCAVYSDRCLAAVESSLAAGDKRMISFHDQVRVNVIPPAEVAEMDPKGLNFFNLNTLEDFEKAEAMLAEG